MRSSLANLSGFTNALTNAVSSVGSTVEFSRIARGYHTNYNALRSTIFQLPFLKLGRFSLLKPDHGIESGSLVAEVVFTAGC